MPSLARLLLFVLHWMYYLLSLLNSLAKTFLIKTPRDLDAERRRIPRHLAIIFALPDKSRSPIVTGTLADSVERAANWCRLAGIERLTVYDNQGVLVNCSQEIRDRLVVNHDAGADTSDSDVEYPLTPPISRPLSPNYALTPEELSVVTLDLFESRKPRSAKHKFVLTRRRPEKTDGRARERPLIVHIVTKESSKLTIVAASRSLARTHRRSVKNAGSESKEFNLSIEVLESMLEGEQGLPAPDLLMVHPLDPAKYDQTPLELHGFPPWQIRLTEIFYCRYPDSPRGWLNWSTKQVQSVVPLDEMQFRAALDEYAETEMRLGK